MIRFFLFLVLTGTSLTATSASFDCAKVQTKVEKLICANPQLSELDSKLEETYLNSRKDVFPENNQRIVSEQKHWLKRTRNRCADEACLQQVYTSRIDALDPFADKNLTCENMRKYSERIFSGNGIDLGSGFSSPINVDYNCPESLVSLPFLKSLLGLTETIRREEGPQECTGSIIHAHWRYYHFDLAKAGFVPLIFLKDISANHTEASYVVLDYFKQWSEKSPYNYQLHSEFFSEFDKALPKLAKSYKKTFGMPETQAMEAAKRALMLLVERASGGFPRASFKPESKIVKLVSDAHSTPEDLKVLLAGAGHNRQEIAKDQIYQALQTALLHNRSSDYITILLGRLSSKDITAFQFTEEPLLSFAIRNHENLQILLKNGVSENYENDFGKTALFYAIGFNDHEAVEILLHNKADVNHAYKTAAELGAKDGQCSYPSLKHTKRTPLMHAAQHADVEMLKLLIKHGAALSAIDERGFNALDFAVVMAKNKENEAYLKSLGLEQNAPAYTPESTSNELKPLTTVIIDGYINKLTIAVLQPNILLASVTPWDKFVPDETHGLYLFSLADPYQPRVISHFPAIKADDFAVSPDGKTVYLINQWYDGASVDKKYGLLIIDISKPENPRLSGRIDGSFMAMHLSRNGEYLYLQERELANSLVRGILVYSVGKDAPKLICTNPFRTVAGVPLFAYSFTEMSDERQLAIYSRSRGISLYEVKDPCKPTAIFLNASSDEFGPVLIGLSNKTVMSGVGGLCRFQLAEPAVKIFGYSWPAGSQYFSVNERLNVSAAVFDKNVAVFKNKPDGHFSLSGQYRFDQESLGDVFISDTGQIYMSGKGKLSVGSVLSSP